MTNCTASAPRITPASRFAILFGPLLSGLVTMTVFDAVVVAVGVGFGLHVHWAGLAVLTVLLLRGPQTTGELRGRSERVVDWPSLAAVEQVLDELIERGYAARLERRPGQKEERFVQLLGGEVAAATPETDGAAPAVAPPAGQKPSPAGADSTAREVDPVAGGR